MVYSHQSNSVFNPDPYYSEACATFGDRLCAARDAAGLSQKILASKMGVKVRTIQAWESDSTEPRANKLQMVSALLNVSMVWLMSGLGTGIDPPELREKFSKGSFQLEMLTELRAIRADGESLLKRIALLDKKISENSEIREK